MGDAIGTFGTMIAISPPAVRHTPDHPPYAEMIQSAIRSLAEEEGSTFSAIDDYIKANYHDLPWGHPNLYPHYLRKLLSARELFLSPSGCFLLSGPHLPPPDLPTPPSPTPKRRWAGHTRTGRQISSSIKGRFIKLDAVAPTRTLKRRRKRGRPEFFKGAISNRRARAAVGTARISLARDVEPLQIAGEGGSQLQPDSGSTPGNRMPKRKRGRPRLYEATGSSRNARAAAKTGVPLAHDVAPLRIAVEGRSLSEPDAGSKRGATVRRRKRGRSRFSMATFRSRKVRAAATTGVSRVEEVEPLQIAVEEGGPSEPDAGSKRRATLPKRKRGRPKLFMSTIRSRKLQDAAETGVSPMKDVEPLQVAVEEGGPSEPDVGLKLTAMISKCRRGLPRLSTETVGSRMVRAAAMIGVSPVKDIEPLQIAVEAGGSLTLTQLGKYLSSDGADHVPSTSTDIVVTEVPLGFTTPLWEVQQNISNAHVEAVPSSNLVDAVEGIMTDITLTLPSPTCSTNPPSGTPVPRKRGRPVKKSGPKASLKKSGSIHFVDSSLVPADTSQLENTNTMHSNDGVLKLPVNLSAHIPELTDTTNDRAAMLPLEVDASESVVGNVVFSEKHDAYSIDDHGGGTVPLDMDVSQFSVDNAVGSGNNEANTISDFGTALPLERKASESLVDNVVGSEKHGAQSTSEFGGRTSPLEIEVSESLVDNAVGSEKQDVQTPCDLGGVTLPLEIDDPESLVDNAVGSEKEGQYELPNLTEEEVTQLPETADTDGECGELLPLERKSLESEEKYVSSNKQPSELTDEGITRWPEVADTDGEHGGLLHMERKFSESEDKHVSSEKRKAQGSSPEHRAETPKVIDEEITPRPGVADTDSEHGGLLPLDRKTPESDKRANSKKRKARWTPPEHRPEPPKLRPRVTKQ